MSNAAYSFAASPSRRAHAFAQPTSVTNEEAPFCFEDYVQLACTLRKSVRIRATAPGGQNALVIIYRGELWRVLDDRGSGSNAFKRMVGRPCVAHVEYLSEADRGPRNVFCNWQKLLLLVAMDSASPSNPRMSGVRLLQPGPSPTEVADPTPDRAIPAPTRSAKLAPVSNGSRHVPSLRNFSVWAFWQALREHVTAVKHRLLALYEPSASAIHGKFGWVIRAVHASFRG